MPSLRVLVPGHPRRTAVAASLLAALAAAACASRSGRVRFRCDGRVNGGALLTVDLVSADRNGARRIQQIGQRWFYEAARRRASDALRTLTFSADAPRAQPGGAQPGGAQPGGAPPACERVVEVKAPKGRDWLVVIGDFRYAAVGPERYLVVLPRERWTRRTVEVSLRDRGLHVRVE